MRLYIIRHAEPDYENHTITPAGHLEAKALAERLVREGVDLIYSSPLGRAMHTMQYTANLAGINSVVAPWTVELKDWQVTDASGDANVVWNIDGESVRGRKPYPSHQNWHRHPLYKPYDFQPKYETIKAESDRFLEGLGYRRKGGKYEIVQNSRKKVAVFCHLGFGLSWLAHLLELPLPLVWSGFWLAPSSVTTILMDERSSEWAVPRCIGMGDVSHLYRSDLPVSSMGIVSNFE